MKQHNVVANGLAIGLGFGTAIGLALHNLALGIGLGTAIGLSIGAAMERRRR